MFLGKLKNETAEVGTKKNSLIALVSPRNKRQANFLVKIMKSAARNSGSQGIAEALTVNALSKPKQSLDKAN